MIKPPSFVTAGYSHSEPAPKCVLFFVEQSSASYETRFAEHGLYRHTGTGHDHQHGLVRAHIKLFVASNGRKHSAEPRYV